MRPKQRPKIACCFSSQVLLRAVANSRFSSPVGSHQNLQWSKSGASVLPKYWSQCWKFTVLPFAWLLLKNTTPKPIFFPSQTPESFAWKNGSYVALMSLVEMFAPVQNKPFAEERDQNVLWPEGIQLVSLTFSCFQFSHLSPPTTTIAWMIATTPSSRSFCASVWSWPKEYGWLGNL